MLSLDMNTLANACALGVAAYTAKTLLATSKGLAVMQQRQDDHEKQDDTLHTDLKERVTRVEDRLAS